MAKQKTYSREQQIPDRPFDVADWGEKPDAWPDGLFRSEEEYRAAVRAADDLPDADQEP